jgi:hypothetical protein
MTENEYILVRNLAIVSTALTALRDTVSNLDGVVMENERMQVLSILAEWQEKAYKKIKIEESKKGK